MKICIICHDFREDNLRLQPWRYIFEMAIGMKENKNDVTIITDGDVKASNIHNIAISYVKRIRSLPFIPNNELISVIKSKKANLVLISISTLDFLHLNTFKRFKIPIFGIFTGPIYSHQDILRLGWKEIINNINYYYIHCIYSSIPSYLVRHIANSNNINRIIVLSRKNRDMLESKGVVMSKVLLIPAGVDDYDLKKPNVLNSSKHELGFDEASFSILYFGSLISIRGVYNLIEAMSKLKGNYPRAKLLILSRRIGDDPSHAEINVKKLIAKLGIEEQIYIISDQLSKDCIKGFILSCDVVALPFKLVPSDMPISILETMAMGKAIISTNIDGISELIEDGRGFIIEPNNKEELINVIKYCINDKAAVLRAGEKAAKYMQEYPRWSQLSSLLAREILPFSPEH